MGPLLAQCDVPEMLQPIYISLLEKFEVAMVTNQQHIIIPSLMPVEAQILVHDESVVTDNYQPPLRRFWYSSYIPDGFWPRLICRIVKDNHITRADTIALKTINVNYKLRCIFVQLLGPPYSYWRYV